MNTYYQIYVSEFPTPDSLRFYEHSVKNFETLEQAKEVASSLKRKVNLSVKIFRVTSEEV